MESYFLDWANLLLRWAHVVTVIAWIGASFYFVFLDLSLTPPQDQELAQVTCPIGIPGIAGKEPEVIAVAVAAQLLQS